LCDAHHRALHAGQLIITGTAPHDLVFTHADGRPYGTPPPEPHKDIIADAESAMRNLGFSAAHARQAVSQVRAHVGPVLTIEDLVRAALRAQWPGS